MLATVAAPTVTQATGDVASLISDGMSLVAGQPILLAMFGLALMVPVLKVIKRLFKTAR